MSSSTLTAPASPKSLEVRYNRTGVRKDASGPLLGVLEKLNVAEQVTVRRHSRQLPRMLVAVWREIYQCLDFEDFQKQLVGDALKQFVRKMRRHFLGVRFNYDQLQEQLNLLEHCGIQELPGVRDCVVKWDSSKGDCFAKWPLHSLAKLLPRLHRLELHMPLQWGFFEQFGRLKWLALHEDASAEALAAIWLGCGRLKCLQIMGRGTADISGISKSAKLQELTLPVAALTEDAASEIFQLPHLKFLELLQQDATPEATLQVISLVLNRRLADIKTLQINGSRLGPLDWLRGLQLQRCPRLDGLMLIDCQFAGLDVFTLGSWPRLCYAAFCHCPDLSDRQLKDFVHGSPMLTQLYLIGCTQLTTKVLFDLFNMRCIQRLGTPTLGLYLPEGELLHDEFQRNVSSIAIVYNIFSLNSSLSFLLVTVHQADDARAAGHASRRQPHAERAVHICPDRVQPINAFGHLHPPCNHPDLCFHCSPTANWPPAMWRFVYERPHDSTHCATQRGSNSIYDDSNSDSNKHATRLPTAKFVMATSSHSGGRFVNAEC